MSGNRSHRNTPLMCSVTSSVIKLNDYTISMTWFPKSEKLWKRRRVIITNEGWTNLNQISKRLNLPSTLQRKWQKKWCRHFKTYLKLQLLLEVTGLNYRYMYSSNVRVSWGRLSSKTRFWRRSMANVTSRSDSSAGLLAPQPTTTRGKTSIWRQGWCRRVSRSRKKLQGTHRF
jgi:hypothetical protein